MYLTEGVEDDAHSNRDTNNMGNHAHRIVTLLKAAGGEAHADLSGEPSAVHLGAAMKAASRLGISGVNLFSGSYSLVPELSGVVDFQGLCQRDVLRDR